MATRSLTQIPSPPINESLRTDCPTCGGTNTFSVTNLGGTLVFNCFRAGCTIRGARKTELTKSELAKHLAQMEVRNDQKFLLPELTSALNSNDAMIWMHSAHCTDAYYRGLADIRYSPKENRIVFLIRDDQGEIIGAAGRILEKPSDTSYIPKWRNYHKKQQLFRCLPDPDSSVAVLVEDAASACALSRFDVNGLALLGTYVTDGVKEHLAKYRTIVIALDNDASDKALKLQGQLRGYIDHVQVLFISKDFKDMSKDFLQHVVEKYITR